MMSSHDRVMNSVITEVDAALKADESRCPTATPAGEAGILKGLPRLLRTVGATLVILAALTFLAQRWGAFDHIERYFAFLGFTLILSGAGFFCGVKIKEDKGARTFLAIAATIVPVHFCQLGALLYSRVIERYGTSITYSPYLMWQAPTDFAAVATVVVGLLALVPVTYISFSVLIRAHAREVTRMYLAANALLLIPSREVNLMGLFVGALLVILTRFDNQTLRGAHESRTKEGVMVRSMLFLPLLALIGRTLQLYFLDISALFSSIVMASIACFLFFYLPGYLRGTVSKSIVQLLSSVPAFGAWICVSKEIFGTYSVESSLKLVVLGLPMAMLSMVMSLRAEDLASAALRRLGSGIAVITVVMNLLIFGGFTASLLAILSGLIMIASGYGVRSILLTLCGGIVFLMGLGHHLRFALNLYHMYPWISLGAIGTGVIVLSSYLERHREGLIAKLSAVRENFLTQRGAAGCATREFSKR